MNPGGSVKDRAAKAIVLDAEKQGVLKPGGLIVEGTAGNTGIGLALVGNSRGYRTLIVIPETQSQEKKDMLRLSGAELKEVPAVPYRDPQNYIKISGRLAEELNQNDPKGAIWANQFDNVANRQAHYETTGPEIWEQTEGKVDAFICAVGTGGTLAGTGAFLMEKNPEIQIGLADPLGAALYAYYTEGELRSWGDSITEGIGQGRITANLEDAVVDHPFQIPDDEALPVCFQFATGGRALPREFLRDQRRWCNSPSQRIGPWENDCHHPLRQRNALSVQTLQSTVPEKERTPRS